MAITITSGPSCLCFGLKGGKKDYYNWLYNVKNIMSSQVGEKLKIASWQKITPKSYLKTSL